MLKKIHHEIRIDKTYGPMITFWHEDGSGVMLDRGSGWNVEQLRLYANVFATLADELELVRKKLQG